MFHVPEELIQSEEFGLTIKQFKLTGTIVVETSDIDDGLSHNEWAFFENVIWNSGAKDMEFDW